MVINAEREKKRRRLEIMSNIRKRQMGHNVEW
jgi:hypothetical protein